MRWISISQVRRWLSSGNFLRNDEFESTRIREWPALLAWNLEDVDKREKLSTQLNVNADVLIEKIEMLTPLQAMWLLHTIRKYGDTRLDTSHVTG
ncbi:MAG: hypothetical protein U9N38_01045 [Thermodesulfobacteriota bacterium]|nr:hypothetical protein [Thermodesulfobacteriota bacterium]